MSTERSRNGGVDRVPLPVDTGGLWLCGKHLIGPDPEAAVARTGATTVVCLNEEDELAARYPEYVAWLRANPDRAVWFPVPDLHVPTLDELTRLVEDLAARVSAGETLLVHCGAGIGRAGTIAVALLMRLGASLDEAITTVADARPMAGPEVGPQHDLLRAIAEG